MVAALERSVFKKDPLRYLPEKSVDKKLIKKPNQERQKRVVIGRMGHLHPLFPLCCLAVFSLLFPLCSASCDLPRVRQAEDQSLILATGSHHFFTGPLGPLGCDATAAMTTCVPPCTLSCAVLPRLLTPEKLLQEMGNLRLGMDTFLTESFAWHHLSCGCLWLGLFWICTQNSTFCCFPRHNKRRNITIHQRKASAQTFLKRRKIGMCRKVAGRRYVLHFKLYRLRGRRLRNRHLLIKSTQFVHRARTHENLDNWFEQNFPTKQCLRRKFCAAVFGHNIGRFLAQWWLGNRMASLTLLICRVAKHSVSFNPWVGCRIGEAKNPGPGGGSATTRRKRLQKQQVQQQDVQLATQLLAVLDNFQVGHKQKRPRTVQATKSGQKSLAEVLIEALQQAVSERWNDAEVANNVAQTLKPYVQVPCQANWEEDLPDPVQHEAPGDASWSWYNTSWWNSDETTQPSTRSAWSRSFRQPASVAKDNNPVQTDRVDKPETRTTRWSGARFAAKVAPLQWTANPKLTTLNQLKKSLEESGQVDANLIISKDDISQDIKQLWDAYGIASPLTVARVVAADQPGPCVSIWWDLSKARSHKPVRCKVQTWQAAPSTGPVPQKPQIIEDFKIKDSPKLVTVRVLAPDFYRKHVPGVRGHDSAQSVLAEWAQLLNCRVAALCGGNWQRVHHKHGDIVIGSNSQLTWLTRPCCSPENVASFLRKLTKALRLKLFGCKGKKI